MKKFFSNFQNIFFHRVLENSLTNCKTVLDVGCGHSSALGNIKRSFTSEGIDIHEDTIRKSKRNKTHDKFRTGDIRKLNKIYRNNSFDACVAIDVIEHFSKKDAIKLIKDMESVASKTVILLTPNGFFEQHDYDGNPYQEHKSGWTKKDLERLGYKIYGLRGLKFIRDDHATIKYKPWIFWGFAAFLSEILFFKNPSLSFDLFAVKKLNK